MIICTSSSVFTVLFFALQLRRSYSIDSEQLDDQCSSYCYQVVKPLLQFVDTSKVMATENTELQNTIKLQAENITTLNELIKSKDTQLMQQIKLSEKFERQILNQKTLIKLKLFESCEGRNRTEQKLIDKYRMQSVLKLKLGELVNLVDHYELKVYDLNATIKNKDKKIQSDKVNNEELVNVITNNVGWIVIQRRKDGSVDFNRSWSEYKKGFGDERGEFFLGLEKIYLLTQSQPHELFISLTDFNNETRYARYNRFRIGNETEVYELKELGSYSGNAGDAMERHINEKFSASGNDHSSENCSKIYNSGWWFKNGGCYLCNLNGRYAFTDTDKDIPSMDWNEWKLRPMKFAHMMIRPVN
ncbi:fibrinogen-like protein 1 isoform X2 [Drosophila sulfurigaster albostrigata]|uniref:fibrinogen-like protein 1 isoform X2 n=1 Tax=Drosophila sulfurigaster albostrigata TaxID=89887 RepID=UPI002D21CAB7|nr:fibrinogen-like protein 1 isoform X2 [Drosophila sulfurigaster albostrigata]